MLLLLTIADRGAASPAGELRIRIYDYAAVPPGVMNRAKQEVSVMLGKAGVRASWLNCEILQQGRGADNPCADPRSSNDIYLRIYDRGMAYRSGSQAGCAGFSLLAPGLDSIAAVYYHRGVELARVLGIPQGPIFGAVIAHEVGHLLLESPRHSKAGLMSAGWDHKVLLRISRGQLAFSASEIRLIERGLNRRTAALARRDNPAVTVAMYF